MNQKSLALMSEKTPERTSERILDLLRSNPTMTIANLSHQIGVSTRNIERNINRLKYISRLCRRGSSTAGYWEVMGETTLDTPLMVSEKTSERTSENMPEKTPEKILNLLRRNPTMTIAALSRQIGIDTRNIERNIRKLKNSFRLYRRTRVSSFYRVESVPYAAISALKCEKNARVRRASPALFFAFCLDLATNA